MHRRGVSLSRNVLTAALATAAFASTILVEPVSIMAMSNNLPDIESQQPDDGVISYNR